MPTFIVAAPPGVSETDSGRLESFLKNKGLAVESVSVAVDRDTQAITYIIEADRNPAVVLDGTYTRTKTAAEQARDKLAEVKPKLLDGSATTAEMRQALLALIVLSD